MANKSVLITGASTGIGRACAQHLDRLGFEVFAGVRKPADGEDLERCSTRRLTPVLIDVTDQASIDSTAEAIAERLGRAGLWGLVNNAGIAVSGPLEYLGADELRRQLEVNVVGQLAVTHAFLPQIRRAKGRIVFMSSIAGRTRSLPFIGPYSASKSALEALAESLRLELLPWDMHVALVEPGSIATPIWEKGSHSVDQTIESLPREGRELYGESLERARRISDASGRRGIAPDAVAEKVAHALTAERPKTRYLVGNDAKARAVIENRLPDRIRDRLVARIMRYEKISRP